MVTMRVGVAGSSSTFDAQALDVDVEGLGVADVVGAPHPVDEHVAGEHPAGVLEQQREQLELLERQPHVGRRGCVTSWRSVVEADVADLDHVVVDQGQRRGASSAERRRSTARMRATSSRSR